MSPLFMDTVCQPHSPGSEREEDRQRMENRGDKRRQTNRDAARKSRKKQTERADELHEELQSLEQSNSALEKEIAALKKEIHLYTAALERHKPSCCLSVSDSTSTNHLSVSKLPVDATLPHINGSSPPGNPPQTSSSSSPSPSTPVTPGLGRHSVDSAHLSPSPAEIFTTTALPSSTAASGVFSSQPLFGVELPALLNGNGPASLLSSLAAPPVGHPGVLDDFLMKPASFTARPSNAAPAYPGSREAAARGFPGNVQALPPSRFNGYPITSSLPHNLSPSPLRDAALPSLSVPPQANQSPSPETTTTFSPKPGYCQGSAATPLLSLLTVPSPLNVPPTTSSNSDRPVDQQPSHVDHLPARDFPLSEILDIDWILNGTSNL